MSARYSVELSFDFDMADEDVSLLSAALRHAGHEVAVTRGGPRSAKLSGPDGDAVAAAAEWFVGRGWTGVRAGAFDYGSALREAFGSAGEGGPYTHTLTPEVPAEVARALVVIDEIRAGLDDMVNRWMLERGRNRTLRKLLRECLDIQAAKESGELVGVPGLPDRIRAALGDG